MAINMIFHSDMIFHSWKIIEKVFVMEVYHYITLNYLNIYSVTKIKHFFTTIEIPVTGKKMYSTQFHKCFPYDLVLLHYIL